MNLPFGLKSGREGDWVYYVRGTKQFRRRYVRPVDRRSPAQLRVRAALGAASKFWSHNLEITEAQRDAWEAAANKRQSRVRLGQSGPLTGQQHFVGRACALAHQTHVAVAQVSKPVVSRVSKPAARAGARPTWKSAIRQTRSSALRRRIGPAGAASEARRGGNHMGTAPYLRHTHTPEAPGALQKHTPGGGSCGRAWFGHPWPARGAPDASSVWVWRRYGAVPMWMAPGAGSSKRSPRLCPD